MASTRKNRRFSGYSLILCLACAAAGLDAWLAFDGYRASLGGDPLAAAVGAIIPLAALGSAWVARKKQSLLAALLSGVLVLAAALGNWLSLSGRIGNAVSSEAMLQSNLHEADKGVSEAKNQLARLRTQLSQERDAIEKRLTSELSSGRGRRAYALEQSLLRAEERLAEFDATYATRLAHILDQRRAAAADLVVGKSSLPPQLRAIRALLPEDYHVPAQFLFTAVLAFLLAALGPALAAVATEDSKPLSKRKKLSLNEVAESLGISIHVAKRYLASNRFHPPAQKVKIGQSIHYVFGEMPAIREPILYVTRASSNKPWKVRTTPSNEILFEHRNPKVAQQFANRANLSSFVNGSQGVKNLPPGQKNGNNGRRYHPPEQPQLL